jgi:hypothetical protein
MDENQFAAITKAMGQEETRRGTIARLVGGLAAAVTGVSLASAAEAKGKKRKKRSKAKSRTGQARAQDVVGVPCPTPGNADKVLWCHATSSETNPYQQICIDDSGADDTGNPNANHSSHEGDCNCIDALCICDPNDRNGTCCKCADAAPVCKKNVCSDTNGQCAAVADPNQNGNTCGDPAPVCQKRVCDNGDCVLKPDSSQDGKPCGDAPECQKKICNNGTCETKNDPNGDPCDASGDGKDDGFCCEGVCYDCPEDQHLDLATCRCVGGCTLTQGYWKTHSRKGPAPYDDAWGVLGAAQEDTPFFISGQTWYQVLWTAPGGNPYYILAHQYIAAKLNILNGSSSTAAVNAVIADAEKLFAGKSPSGSFSRSEKAAMTAAASTLDQYNNGLIGPGHCD